VHETPTALSTWESFYVIVGSSGGALIGLQFVVITLLESRRRLADSESVGAFGTPTVVHFAAALLVAAIMSAPWPSLFSPSIALTCCGIGGLVYCGFVIRRARRQTTYEPVFEDWLWYSMLPCAAYAALALSATIFLHRDAQTALFVVGGSALGLLLIGIHNAWDSITHIVVSTPRSEDAGRD
jgi:hypothetical protein